MLYLDGVNRDFRDYLFLARKLIGYVYAKLQYYKMLSSFEIELNF